jgi:AcrR family transcriptional regulator
MYSVVKEKPRPYVMTARADSAAATRARLVESAAALLAANSFDGMTLEAIAAGAATTPRTALRIFGSKEALFAAALDRVGESGFGPVRAGEVDATLDSLYDFYEMFGDMVIRWLADEPRVAAMRDHLNAGRRNLRAWVGESFAPTLDRLEGGARKQMHNALIVALDVYTWKLLRRDFGLSRKAAGAVARRIVAALIEGG